MSDSQRNRPILGKIGRWNLEACLGSGGIGSVFLGRHEITSEIKRAVKVIPCSRDSYGEEVSRFEVECGIADKLMQTHNPHIVPFYEWGSERNLFYIVMELVRGETVLDKMRSGAIGTHDALQIGRDVAYALEVAHGLGVLHQDIKPANVMLDYDKPVALGITDRRWLARLVDWGIGRRLRERPDIERHLEGITAGTIAYAAPEVIDHFLDSDNPKPTERAEVFGFGKVLYEMLSVQAPRKEEDTIRSRSAEESKARTKMSQYEAMRLYHAWRPERLPHVSDELNFLVGAATAREPRFRPGIRDVRIELERMVYQADAGAKTGNVLIRPQPISMDGLLKDLSNDDLTEEEFKMRNGAFLLIPKEGYEALMQKSKALQGVTGFKVYYSPEKPEWVVGRGDTADIRIAQDTTVSGTHALIHVQSDEGVYNFSVRDLHSKHGTRLVQKRKGREQYVTVPPQEWREMFAPAELILAQYALVFTTPDVLRAAFRMKAAETREHKLDVKTPDQWKTKYGGA